MVSVLSSTSLIGLWHLSNKIQMISIVLVNNTPIISCHLLDIRRYTCHVTGFNNIS